jgi:mitochondrial fission protein ELM1
MGERHRKLRQFHTVLMDHGITRRFAGKVEHWSYDPPNDTEKIAAIVYDHFRQSRASAG